jgi:quercetin dioxygenase-like cupin family protein
MLCVMTWAALLWLLAAAVQPAVLVEHEPMHRIVFENDIVRVIDAAVAAGQATAYHTHERDNVPVAVVAGRTRVTPKGGPPVDSDVALGRVNYAVGGYTHEVRNIGRTLVRFIDVELRGPRGTATGARCPSEGHSTEIDNGRVVVHRVRVPAGGLVPRHQHAGPVLEVVVSGGGVSRGESPPVTPAPGSHAWRADGDVPRIANVGPVEFELVEIEWKP